jgi:hypothetical protein
VAQRTETPAAHEMTPPHTLDRDHEGLQRESHEDIGSVKPKDFYPGETHFQIMVTLSIILLVDENLVSLNIQQIPDIFECVK